MLRSFVHLHVSEFLIIRHMNILHLLTFSSEFNAIPLRCPFHALAIVQVGFAGAEMFLAPSCFRVLDKSRFCQSILALGHFGQISSIIKYVHTTYLRHEFSCFFP